MRELDHLIVAARSVDEGAAWVESKLGVAMAGGGKHALMGTHNRLLKLDARRYLEVIAVDPEAPPPARPRWFELDSAPMRSRLAKGPALVHWVERTDDLERELHDSPEMEVLTLSRGPYRWRMGVARDGRLPGGGAAPTLLQWEGGLHPWDALPETGVSLLEFGRGEDGLSATFVTPSGSRRMP